MISGANLHIFSEKESKDCTKCLSFGKKALPLQMICDEESKTWERESRN
jgi:hypothetical protein